MGRVARMCLAAISFAAAGTSAAAAAGPSFDCAKVAKGSIEERVCTSAELSALDRKLAEVFAAAAAKATNEHPPVLKAEQRGWIKGRDDCWKSQGVEACVKDAYVRRIAELQARYRLVPGTTVTWICDGNPANEVIVTWFDTDPRTGVAEYGDSTSFLFPEVAASGAKYAGRNESYWEHQGEATIQWGYEAPKMKCARKP